MTIRNLDYLFKPSSVALIGASTQSGSVGAVLAHNLISADFGGPIMPVNPKYKAVHGVTTYPDIDSLPTTPDLGIIATPADTVPDIITQLGRRGTRAAVVISAGFSESGDEDGRALQQEMLDAARPHTLRIIGPNCLGIILPGTGLNASFSHLAPETGHLAFVTQSGAIVTSIVDWARNHGIGFSHLISLGNMSDVDFGDTLDYLANDSRASAILLYIESISSARKFMSAARAAARSKPVIVVKAGRHAEGARAAASHTGALAGADEVYDAAFRRAGMLRVFSLTELFDAAATLSMTWRASGDRLAILTNGGGIGVLATDAVIDEGARLVELEPETLDKLDEVLPATWSHGNPVDIVGDAPGSRYADALRVLCADKNIDGILVLNCPTAVASSVEAAQAVVEVAETGKCRNLLTSWVGESTAEEARQLFRENRIPTYDTPEQAVRAFMYLVDYKRNQETLMETPPSVPEDFSPDVERARAVVQEALSEEREWLMEHEAKEVLTAYGIPTSSTRLAETPRDAASAAAQIGGAVALKIASPDITHKTDVGGVVLDLLGPAAVREAAQDMMDRVREAKPDARVTGFTVQPMIHRPGAYELIIGLVEDAQFGPVILFGHGGTAVEVVKDKAVGLPPLNMRLAREIMSRTRIYNQLRGHPRAEAVDLDAIALTLIRTAQIAVDIPEVDELDINPLLADTFGVVALDARVKVKRDNRGGTGRLAIRPYPKELEENIPLGDGSSLWLRPIRPEDEPALRAAFAKLTPREVQLRFFAPMKTLSHMAASRFSQIDYDREMALILTEHGIPGKTEIYGVVRLIADPDNESAEYAIIVRHDMTGQGLGIYLMRRIIDYARDRGIGEIYGDVLRENDTMLKVCDIFGFTQSNITDEPTQVRVTLKLT
ncbi:MAG: bifunctional acetate--CoA ligase family protein/GNAT family N-acetyltransferase [Gammaproteobacteria bacterium]|nr:bifunctional acetate--CoA ligase family protein/GNAT family N-acetyltransferase [Gammaproteobacteria bacterium]